MSGKTQNEIGWGKIQNNLNFIEKINSGKEFTISAKQIKKIGEREPRLMAKFDHYSNLPGTFKDNNIGILPISGSDFYLFKFNLYKNLSYTETIKTLEFDELSNYESISINDIKSEDKLLIISDISKLIEDFTGEKELQLTNRGKFGLGIFEFSIQTDFGIKKIANLGGQGELVLCPINNLTFKEICDIIKI